jgi:hypothetical protein
VRGEGNLRIGSIAVILPTDEIRLFPEAKPSSYVGFRSPTGLSADLFPHLKPKPTIWRVAEFA